MFGSGRDVAEVLEEVMRLSARLVLQQVLEEEVTAWLGRGWNSRAGGERERRRNGYGDLTVKTTAGPLALKRPKLRDTTEAFASRLLGGGVVRSEPLEALVISAWVRGLSDRDIEALLAEALGPEAALSRSTASRICARLRDDFEAFRSRDLSGVELDCLFLDGSHFKMHDGSRAEPVLVAYAITTLGRPVLLAVEPGGDESCDAWAGFLADLRARGLRPPLLIVTDGAASLIGPIDTTMACALRQRCLVHRARNVLAKVPAERRDELKAAFWEIFDPPDDICPGETAVRCAQANIDSFARRYEREFPAAVRCLLTDRQALTAHLRFPAEHRRGIRHTNLIEAPSARPAEESKSSAGSPAKRPASHWCGPCSTGPPGAGADSPTHPQSPERSPSSATNSTSPTTPSQSPPNMTTGTCTPKPLLHQTWDATRSKGIMTAVTSPRYCRIMAYTARGAHHRRGMGLAGLFRMFLGDMDASDLEGDR